jgi:type I restriction enzyme R subunit
MSSHFTFLAAEWPALHEAAVKAESLVHPDPRAACFYARRALELAMAWVFKHDAKLKQAQRAALFASLQHRAFKGEL